MYALVLTAHASIGVLALVAYWTAGLAKKGSPTHRNAGKIFMLTMPFILLSALVFVQRMLLRDQLDRAAFFGYLILISVTALATGWLSLKLKKDHRRYTGGWYRMLSLANMLSGAGIFGLALHGAQPVLFGFSFIGLWRGALMWKLAHQPAQPGWWLREHLGSMIGLGVAVHVAFLLTGLDHLLPHEWRGHTGLLGWLLPLLIAAAAGARVRRRYLGKRPTAAE